MPAQLHTEFNKMTHLKENNKNHKELKSTDNIIWHMLDLNYLNIGQSNVYEANLTGDSSWIQYQEGAVSAKNKWQPNKTVKAENTFILISWGEKTIVLLSGVTFT